MDDPLLRTLQTEQKRYGLFDGSETVVVGVSGGPDSLCLLHALHALATGWNLSLHVAHLNHGLRGDDADADAEFVAGLARRWDLPMTMERADVTSLAQQPGISLEEAARQVRYAFLARVANAVSARRIAVAHHADDQAETVLMHFLRGSGLAGLRGMRRITPLREYRLLAAEGEGPAHTQDLLLVRPLLGIARTDIEAYCQRHGLEPRFDRSNEDITFFRNRLRHELLPLLRQYNPQISQVLWRMAAVLGDEYELLQTQAQAAWNTVVHAESGDRIVMDLALWRAQPLALQRALIQRSVFRLRHSLRDLGFEHIEHALWLARDLQQETGAEATLPRRLRLRLAYDTLVIESEEAPPFTSDGPQIEGPMSLNVPGVTPLGGGWACYAERRPADAVMAAAESNTDPWRAFLDAQRVGPHPCLRPRQPGERFRPLGMSGTAKVNEFMINCKLPAPLRDRWPLVVGEAGVAWLPGYRISEEARLRTDSHEALCLLITREDPL